MQSYIGLKYKIIKTRAELFAWIKFCDFNLCSISSLLSVIKRNFCFYCDAKCLFCSAPKVLILRRITMYLEVVTCSSGKVSWVRGEKKSLFNMNCLFKVNSSLLLCAVSNFIVSFHSLHYLSLKSSKHWTM